MSNFFSKISIIFELDKLILSGKTINNNIAKSLRLSSITKENNQALLKSKLPTVLGNQ
jgi:hypothetical protein